uniref:DUF4283 domain-containing protein n=1 Tax=Populus trichocarpa TaxID=3694 RepID=A0A3N7FAK3_POPTR|eukprot:XP_024448005.1 uncharacterized protein LOC18109494 isoform X1 [Populus trichocarpa]
MLLISNVMLGFERRIGIGACSAHPLLFLHCLLLSPCGKSVASSISNRPRHVPSAETGSLRSRPAVGNPNPGSTVGAAAPPPSPGKGKASSGSHMPSSPDHPTDMFEVLSRGPYYVFGQPLILKIMPEFFDFATSEMVRMPVWVRFPNLPLQCWSPLCLSKLASVIGKPVHSDTSTNSMTRLSYARVLIEIDLLADLPTSINIILPNGDSLSQKVMYESLPRFCKQCRTRGHTTSTCTNKSSHKRNKHSQTAPAPSGCSSSSAETAVVEKQSIREEPQGEPGIDPMFVEAAVAVEERAIGSGRKRAKLVSQSSPPSANPSAPLKIVHISEGHSDATNEPPPRRQYLTKSKAAATSIFGHSRRPVGMGSHPFKSSYSADSRTQGNTTTAPSSSL